MGLIQIHFINPLFFRSLSGLVRLGVPSLSPLLASMIWTSRANLSGNLGVSCPKMLQPFGNLGRDSKEKILT